MSPNAGLPACGFPQSTSVLLSFMILVRCLNNKADLKPTKQKVNFMNNLGNFPPAQVVFSNFNSQPIESNPNDYPNAETIQLLTPTNQVIDPATNSQNQPSKNSILQHLRLSLVKMDVYSPAVQVKDYVPTERRDSMKNIVITSCKTNTMNK